MEPPGRPPEPRRRESGRRHKHRAEPAGHRAAREAICRLLLQVARSDATITAEERTILERYRHALEVRAEARSLAAEARPAVLDLEQIPPAERIHVLRMMFRVAYADGECRDVELDLLRRLAGMMGLSAVQFAEVHIATEREAEDRRRNRRRVVIGAGAVGVLVVAVIVALVIELMPPSKPDFGRFLESTRGELGALHRRIDALDTTAGGGGQAREISEKLDRLGRDLVAHLEQLERTGGEPSSGAGAATGRRPAEIEGQLAELGRQVEALRAQLASVGEPQADFKRLERRYSRSVLMIVTRYDLTKGADRVKQAGYGSGFFVTPGGLAVTNKHVVEPWKFLADSVRLLEGGYRLDEASVHRVAWAGGSRVRDDAGRTVFDGAFDSRRGGLKIAALPPDRMERRSEPLADGSRYEGRFHAHDDADLALLELAVPAPVIPLPLAPDAARVEKLDPVVVLGFPTGPLLLETGVAESSPSPGVVRKVESSLLVSASIFPGNSGGPVLDRKGRVIGVATRTAAGEATLGACIQARHALALLPPAPELADEAERWIERGQAEHARALLDLAEARGGGARDESRIAELRAMLRR